MIKTIDQLVDLRAEAQKAIEILTAAGEKATVIGRVTEGEGVVIK